MDDDLGFYRVGRDGFYYAQSISRPVPTFSESSSKVEMISDGNAKLLLAYQTWVEKFKAAKTTLRCNTRIDNTRGD